MSDERDEQRKYREDVRNAVDSITSELHDRLKAGECGESLREWLLEHIDETIDGSARVIYTWKAKMCVVYSDNGGAYLDEFGGEGAADSDGINWSRLAYCAFRADVIEELASDNVDVNAPVPECAQCGDDSQRDARIWEEASEEWRCQNCADEAAAESDTEEVPADDTH